MRCHPSTTRLFSATGLSLFVFLLLVLLPGTASAGGGIIYVDQSATGANDGSSWTDAYTDLQSALAACSGACEIWVAKGVYMPGSHVGDTFMLKEGIALYGGFSGTETARSQRNLALNLTVLSGDIDHNDVKTAGGVVLSATNILGNNAYHVLWIEGSFSATPVTAATRVDGFTVTGGYAWAPDSLFLGAGLYCNGEVGQCNPTIENMVFSGNSVSEWGGAICNNGYGGISNPTLTNVVFSGNVSGQYGGAIYNLGRNGGQSSPVLTNVTFGGNTALLAGAAFRSSMSPPYPQVVQPLPTAVNDAAGVLQGKDVTIDVLANDLDPAGGGLTVAAITQPAQGTVAISGGGKRVIYTASGNAGGLESFSYLARDVNGNMSRALVAVVVTVPAEGQAPPQVNPVDPTVGAGLVFTSASADIDVDD